MATVASVIGVAVGLVPAQYAPTVAAIVGVYAACRTVLKTVHALGYGQRVPDLPEIPVAVTAATAATSIVVSTGDER